MKEVKIHDKTDADIVDFVHELLENARLYSALKFNVNEGYLLSKNRIDESLFEYMRAFRHLEGEQIYAVILASLNKFISTSKYTTKQFQGDLQKMYSFSLRASLLGINPSDYERIFAGYCKRISEYQGSNYNRLSQEFFKELNSIGIIKDKRMLAERIASLVYPDNMILALLYGVIRKQQRGVRLLNPTQEHILPQSPSKWKKTKKEIEAYVNNLGNLTLLHDRDNRDAGNSIMKDKVEKIFEHSGLLINKELVKPEWIDIFTKDPKEAIRKRTKLLVNQILDSLF